MGTQQGTQGVSKACPMDPGGYSWGSQWGSQGGLNGHSAGYLPRSSWYARWSRWRRPYRYCKLTYYCVAGRMCPTSSAW
jgi:hypothetical protein